MTEEKQFWVDGHRFLFIALCLLFVFLVLMTFLYLKADEVTRDPCSICAERMGEEITCYTKGTVPITRTYFPDGGAHDDVQSGVLW